jgi:L-asparaginase
VPATKPVVLTCAMRPATALSPDGPQNLADAVLVAAQDGARGVLLACAGRVHGAVGLRKVHPYRLDPFESGEGVVGYVEDSRWRAARDWPAAATVPAALPGGEWPWVAIVVSHAGADARQVDALVRDGVRGLVLAGTGNGTVHHALAAALREASARGVRVVRTTRCAEGLVVDGGRDAEFETLPLTPVQARVELQLRLSAA